MHHKPSSLDLCTHDQKNSCSPHWISFKARNPILSRWFAPLPIIMGALNWRLQGSFKVRVASKVCGIKAIASKASFLVSLFICNAIFLKKEFGCIFTYKLSLAKRQVAKVPHSPFCSNLTSTFFRLIFLLDKPLAYFSSGVVYDGSGFASLLLSVRPSRLSLSLSSICTPYHFN